MVFHHIDRKLSDLLLEILTKLFKTIELHQCNLFQELVDLELVLISLNNGSQTKKLKSTFQTQHGQPIEVSLINQALNGKNIDTTIELPNLLISKVW